MRAGPGQAEARERSIVGCRVWTAATRTIRALKLLTNVKHGCARNTEAPVCDGYTV